MDELRTLCSVSQSPEARYCDAIYRKCLEQANPQTESRLVVARAGGGGEWDGCSWGQGFLLG